ncbi:Uncharacterized protein dnl_00070 [Desulfonema limicola]|uniref:Uncharacterized protein n=1 Tax=Desulfonema limicola TaxID=45656 RepID=A0A975B2X2_9BACT|nr:Uncharacterized protein dnl_00070 [Desulfonema limicola]
MQQNQYFQTVKKSTTVIVVALLQSLRNNIKQKSLCNRTNIFRP